MTLRDQASFSSEASEVMAVKARPEIQAGRGGHIRSLALTRCSSEVLS